MRPEPLSDFIHTCVLLGEQALLNLMGVGAAGGGGGGGGRKAPRFGSSKTSAAASSGGQQQHGKLSLRVLAQDVKAALKDNPIFRKLIGAE